MFSVLPIFAQGTASARMYLADGFDFPVGKPNAEGYYKARGYWPNGHLGEDWNGVGGGDSDFGDPIYSIARGIVILSEDVRVGWGNCIIVRHVYREPSGKIEMVDALYAHLQERKVKVGDLVERGQLVGTMGGNRGMYPVHLHFEIRKNLQIGMNRMKFARDNSNYYSPTHFIQARRTLSVDMRRYDVPVNNFEPYGKSVRDDSALFDSNSSGVVKTPKGLSIPVITAPGSQPQRTTPAPRPGSSSESQTDFWKRLKTKIGNGQVTPGTTKP